MPDEAISNKLNKSIYTRNQYRFILEKEDYFGTNRLTMTSKILSLQEANFATKQSSKDKFDQFTSGKNIDLCYV
jgi:uncharacterized protein YjcR